MAPCRLQWTPVMATVLLSCWTGYTAGSLLKVTDLCTVNFPEIPFGWNSSKKVVSITFDDAPEADAATKILDVLDYHKVIGSFMINSAAGYPPLSTPAVQAVLKRMVAEGHEIASHSATHPDFIKAKLTRDQMWYELQYVIRNVSQIIGPSAPRITLFRAPYGSPFALRLWNDDAKRVANVVSRLHVHVGWSLEGLDYVMANDSAGQAKFVKAYGEDVVAGNITGPLLLHALNSGAGGNAEGLNKTIAYLKANGYAIVPLEDHVQEIYGMSSAAVVDEWNKRCIQPANPPVPDLGAIPALGSHDTSGCSSIALGSMVMRAAIALAGGLALAALL